MVADMKFLPTKSALVKIADITAAHLTDYYGYIAEKGLNERVNGTASPFTLVVALPGQGRMSNSFHVDDEFPTFEDAVDALSWLGNLLEGYIDVETWNAGRTDKSLRTQGECDAKNTEGRRSSEDKDNH